MLFVFHVKAQTMTAITGLEFSLLCLASNPSFKNCSNSSIKIVQNKELTFPSFNSLVFWLPLADQR